MRVRDLWRIVVAVAALLPLLVGAIAAPPAGAPQSARAARIHADARAILSQSDYQPPKPGPNIVADFGSALRSFVQWLSRFGRPPTPHGNLSINPNVAEFVVWLALGVAIIGIAAAIAYAVRSSWMARGARKPKRKDKKLSVDTIEEEERREPDEWLETARGYAERGDYRNAYRAVFVGLLLRLDRAGMVRYDRSRTNGEYLRALRAVPDVLAMVRPVARQFDACWYGKQPIDETVYRSCVDAYQRTVAFVSPKAG